MLISEAGYESFSFWYTCAYAVKLKHCNNFMWFYVLFCSVTSAPALVLNLGLLMW